MPPRYAYWTILIDSQPTAFRAKDADELLPTFNRLRDKHPGAVMMWFQEGKLGFETAPPAIIARPSARDFHDRLLRQHRSGKADHRLYLLGAWLLEHGCLLESACLR